MTEPSSEQKPPSPGLKIFRAVIGWVLLVLGVLMLVLPGPGLLFVAIGLGLIDLPFSRRLREWLLVKLQRRGKGSSQ